MSFGGSAETSRVDGNADPPRFPKPTANETQSGQPRHIGASTIDTLAGPATPFAEVYQSFRDGLARRDQANHDPPPIRAEIEVAGQVEEPDEATWSVDGAVRQGTAGRSDPPFGARGP